MMNRQRGYSLLEVVVVMFVMLVAIIGVGVNIGPSLITLEIDLVADLVAARLSAVQIAALNGNADPQARRFDLKSALASAHKGIILSDSAPATPDTSTSTSTGTGTAIGACPNQQVLNISGEPFCYRVGNDFTFEQYSGRLLEGHAIFINSKSRKLALVVNRGGKADVAELVNGQWRWRSELRRQPLPGGNVGGSTGGGGPKGGGGGRGDDLQRDPPVGVGSGGGKK